MNLETICVSCMEDDSGSPVCPKCGSPFNLPVTNMLLLPPRTVLRDQYLIGRALGHGGFGITYLAWDIGLQTRLAIKEYLPSGVAGCTNGIQVAPFSEQVKQDYDWGLDRFLEEARVLKRCNHGNIVSVDTIFRANGTAFLVMEYLEGMTFEEFLVRRGGTIPLEDSLRVMLPVMDALSAVHAENILHRDISPDNIYILKTGKVKLIDFGAARNALSQKSRRLSVILKTGYAPEEQYRISGNQGPWSDVYATAATLYRALTGKIPLGSLDRQASDTLEVPSKLGARVPPSVEGALMKALAVRAGDRFQTIEEFKSALTGSHPVSHPAAISLPVQMRQTAPITPVAPAPPPPDFSPPPQALQETQVSSLEAAIQKYEALSSPRSESPAAAVGPLRARRALPKWLVLGTLVGIVALGAAAGWGYFHFYKRSPAPTSLTQWPTQPSGIPQPDEERQRFLEAQQQDLNPAAPAPVGEPRQPPKPIQSRRSPTPQVTQPAPSPQEPGRPVAHAPEAAPPPPVAPPSAPVPSYADMLKQADIMIGNKQVAQAQALLSTAIEANPSGWQAYNALAKLELYSLNQLAQAFEHYRAALAKGGVATLRLSHNRGEGWLSVSPGKASFQSDDGVDNFEAATVKEAKRNKGALLKGGKGHHAFHIRLANGQNYNFEPTSQSPGGEVDFILAVIGT